MGDQFLVLLPETIPFLAELLEGFILISLISLFSEFFSQFFFLL